MTVDLRLLRAPGEDDQAPEPRPRPQPRYVPDMTLALRLLDFFPQGLGSMEQDIVRRALQAQAQQNGYPNPAVRFVLAPDSGVTWVGVWLNGPSALPFDEPQSGQLRFLFDIPELGSSRNSIAMSVNFGTIEREVDKAWTSGRIPHHYDSDGNPCYLDACDIDVYSVYAYFTDLDQPFTPRMDRMYTFVSGRYNPAFPDVNFLLTTTDIFSVSGDGRIVVTSSTSVQRDTTALDVLATIFLIAGIIYTSAFGIGAGIAPFLAAGVFATEDALVHLSTPGAFPGVGPMVVKLFFPRQLLLPGMPPVNVSYVKVQVGASGIGAWGNVAPLLSMIREPTE